MAVSDIYPKGQCTYWSAKREPWCMKYGNLGNALEWATNWQRHGGVVGFEPKVDYIACFQPGVDGAKPLGHVAVVIAVESPQAFRVSEMDAPEPGVVTTRTCSIVSGVRFLVPPSPIPENPMGTEATVVMRSGTSPDPLGPGAVYLVIDEVYGPKRHIADGNALPAYYAACGQTQPKLIDAYILDRMELGPPINEVASPPEP